MDDARKPTSTGVVDASTQQQHTKNAICPNTKVRPEDVLPWAEMIVLEEAREGVLPCPRCGDPLWGEFIYYAFEDDDWFAGVQLTCTCGFREL